MNEVMNEVINEVMNKVMNEVMNKVMNKVMSDARERVSTISRVGRVVTTSQSSGLYL